MKTLLNPYQRKLLIFLSVATFFEGYDIIALSQLLPNLRDDLGISETGGGILVGAIQSGTVLAYLLVRRADQWGRRRTLMVTILGYTTFSLLTAFSPNAVVFGICQLIARVFLIGEWAISMVFAAEEYPAHRRGMIIGVIQAFSSLGAVVCAGLAPILLSTPWGWRSVYVVGAVPLLILAYARRNIRETRRYSEQVGESGKRPQKSLFRIFGTPYKRRMLQLAAIWFLTYMCTQNAVTFWKEFAVAERGLTDGQVGASITIAALVAMPLVFYAGKLLDVVGRRWGAAIIFVLGAVSVLGSYTLHGRWPLTICLIGAIFGASAVLPVLNSYTTELFPTDLRGDAFGWSNNLLGRIGYVLSPVAIGAIAEATAWGPTVAATAIFPILALLLILRWLPETRGRELEDTSSLE